MEYINRETWGALTPRSELRPLVDAKVQGIVVHHTTGPSTDAATMVAAHDRYHRVTRGWSGGLAYNWVVSVENGGRIWEGRGWNQGGATRGWNDKTVAVAFLGDSDKDFPEDAKRAFTEVVAEIYAKYGSHLWIRVHSDFKATGCPGGPLRDWVKSGALSPEAFTAVSSRSDGPREWWAHEVFQRFLDGLRAAVSASPLKRWRRSNDKFAVMAVQGRLNALGHNAGPIDGVYGRRTKRAVKAHQATMWHTTVNGVVSIAVWDSLFPS